MKQAIYYFTNHDLEYIVEMLKEEYELIPLKGDVKIAAAQKNILLSTVHGIVLASAKKTSENFPFSEAHPQRCLIFVGKESDFENLPKNLVNIAYCLLPELPSKLVICKQLETASVYMQSRDVVENAKIRLEGQTQLMYELNRVGMALSAERNTERLLDMIVRKAREVTRSDAASLYLVEPDGRGGQQLRFKYTLNESLDIESRTQFQEFTMPVSYDSMAGFVAESGIPLNIEDVYQMPIEAPYIFNRSFDEKTGYRSKSMLVVPMFNALNYVIGVLQLINHKIATKVKINTPEAANRFVNPYPQDLVDLATSLASQAAVALENSLLYQNIKNLFEGFVSASVKAIEQRDPTTSGHSFRVADLTVGLGELVDKSDEKPFTWIKFSRDQLIEIRYASLLHDFGKVGVREEVLVKAKKLYPLQFELLRWRFDCYRRAVEQKYSERKIEYLLKKGQEDYLTNLGELDTSLLKELKRVDEMWSMVVKSNEPTILAEGSFEKLIEIADHSLLTFEGNTIPLLSEAEVRTLSIPKGSLNDEERREIEQHAYHTFVFLSQIPWVEEWKNIPRIAGYHHEKLNGKGYPSGVGAKEIPIQSRMMTISDIFDALTASDRPYKKAVPVDKALSIIESEVKLGQIDSDLFDLFVKSKIYESVLCKS
jgi:HD-GYP domain-containing protein (c-di-GMP phosphodiesterase class II)